MDYVYDPEKRTIIQVAGAEKKRPNFLGLGVGIAAVLATALFVWAFTTGEMLADRGGRGEACYPNNTCETGLTCWNLRTRNVCEKEIKPVTKAGGRYCYVFKTGDDIPTDSRCFETENECIRSFAILLQSEARVVQGCWHE